MLILFAAALACVDCHKSIVEAYARTPMAITSGPVVAADERGGSVGKLRVVAGEVLHLEFPRGIVDLNFFIGSRRMGRSYAFLHQNHMYQAPIGFYPLRQKWDFAPGYERDVQPDFSRPISADCLFCHATRASLAAGTVNRYERIEHGIQCARCHGESGTHDKLVNPAKLAPRARDSICEQCHLAGEARLEQPGKRLENFRPGQDLADYLEVLIGAPRGLRVNSHSEALALSRCKQPSGDKLWCGMCHNPHARTDANAVCSSCHAKPHQPGNCVGCHMAKSRPSDGGHTVFTNHTIGRGKESRALSSYFGRKLSARNLGIGLAQQAARDHDADALQLAWPLLRQAAQGEPNDPLLHSAIAGLLAASGRKQQAIEYYRLSLKQNPLQPDVLRKLAMLVESDEAARLRSQALEILPVPR